eukprot:6190084-Pleurochrysis_carterae.AAC.3
MGAHDHAPLPPLRCPGTPRPRSPAERAYAPPRVLALHLARDSLTLSRARRFRARLFPCRSERSAFLSQSTAAQMQRARSCTHGCMQILCKRTRARTCMGRCLRFPFLRMHGFLCMNGFLEGDRPNQSHSNQSVSVQVEMQRERFDAYGAAAVNT